MSFIQPSTDVGRRGAYIYIYILANAFNYQGRAVMNEETPLSTAECDGRDMLVERRVG